MTDSGREWDPGLAIQRTSLAWHRTALAIMAGGAIMARLRMHELGVLALAPLLIGLTLGGWTLVESRGGVNRRMGRRGRTSILLTAAVVLLALCEGWVLVAGG
jgi:uncharacterized membrane protein YidH (DUF202 family)